MQCPACREQMIVVEYGQIELDVCVSCKGVWFDADELELLLGSLKLPVDRLVRAPAGKLAERPRRCPYCRRKMEKVLIGLGPEGGEVIDRCKRGHGLWFDGGELDTIVNGLKKPLAAGEKGSEKVGSFLADVLLAGRREGGGDSKS